MEIWKNVPIAEYDEIYLISSKGRLKNIKRNKIHAICLDSDGYPHYLLCNRGKRKAITAHRLVALAFIDNPNDLPCVNHKDENKLNNSVDNLEWCDVKYNNAYGTRNKRVSDANSQPIAQILNGEIIAVYRNSIEAERATGVDFSKIRLCCRGGRKTAGGYQWKDLIEKEVTEDV